AMVKDLDLGIEIIGVPTFREDDGLALSSRNAYLNDKQRRIAPSLYDTLQLVAQKVKDGADPSRAKADGTMHLLSNGFRRVDYIDIRDAETLAPFNPARHNSGRILGAAWLGQTRLIDNIPL
ncbi:MAG: pantoate--beta-alanine ligase, partial [Pseudomonadota bacterium]